MQYFLGLGERGLERVLLDALQEGVEDRGCAHFLAAELLLQRFALSERLCSILSATSGCIPNGTSSCTENRK